MKSFTFLKGLDGLGWDEHPPHLGHKGPSFPQMSLFFPKSPQLHKLVLLIGAGSSALLWFSSTLAVQSHKNVDLEDFVS